MGHGLPRSKADTVTLVPALPLARLDSPSASFGLPVLVVWGYRPARSEFGIPSASFALLASPSPSFGVPGVPGGVEQLVRGLEVNVAWVGLCVLPQRVRADEFVVSVNSFLASEISRVAKEFDSSVWTEPPDVAQNHTRVELCEADFVHNCHGHGKVEKFHINVLRVDISEVEVDNDFALSDNASGRGERVYRPQKHFPCGPVVQPSDSNSFALVSSCANGDVVDSDCAVVQSGNGES